MSAEAVKVEAVKVEAVKVEAVNPKQIIDNNNGEDIKRQEEPIIPPEPHTANAPIIGRESLFDSSNLNSLQQFFSTPDHAPAIPFFWAVYGDLRLTAPNVVELIQNSCKQISENSKYIDINYSYLAEYAKTKLNFRNMNLGNNDSVGNRTRNVEVNDRSDWISKMTNLNERDTINILCLFMMLRFGSGFANAEKSDNIAIGIQNMYKLYGNLTTKTLSSIEWNIELISTLFEINYNKPVNKASKSLCDMIRKCIEEVIHILSLKAFVDFAEYIYYHIDLAWIKSQTKELSALEDVKWKLNKNNNLGLELAPTKSKQIRRCVVVGFTPTDEDPLNMMQNNTNLKRLVKKRAFIYAINDQVVYNLEFEQIINKIKQIRNDEIKEDELLYGIIPPTKQREKFITIQFGLHLDREPNTVQALLFNFINDFPCLNDQYLYKNLFGEKKNLKVYLFQKVQLIVKELHYNLYTKKGIKIFNFKDINSLLPLYNTVPFVLLQDNVLKIKKQFKNDFDKYTRDKYILKPSDLEIEIRANAIWATKLLLKHTLTKNNALTNIHAVTNYLFNKGQCFEYSKYSRHYVRDTIYY